MSGLMERLEAIYLDGCADEVSGDVEAPCGHFYRVGRSIVVTNSQGFKDDYHFADQAEAESFFDSLQHQYGVWMGEGTVTRETQVAEVIYVLPDGTAFWSPDGEGRYWYDSLTLALEANPNGTDAVVIDLDEAPED